MENYSKKLWIGSWLFLFSRHELGRWSIYKEYSQQVREVYTPLFYAGYITINTFPVKVVILGPWKLSWSKHPKPR